ncbi:MAG: iron-sulfur cluster carrier protein ApbC [Candidatus Methylomirabilis sp.]|nr:iron-sulfur cluster carrier protein ApbC [Deltaproteobacteria bacterium]
MAVTQEHVLAALRRVQDPDLRRDIVTLGFVKDLEIDGGAVRFLVELTTPACPVKEQLKKECEEVVAALPGVARVEVRMTAQTARRALPNQGVLPGVKNAIAVASGKGGVGKSTVATNLALALSAQGASVGLLDADIYGPSIPIMMGVSVRPNLGPDRKILPIDKHGLRLMSMGFIADKNTPVIWRGPMVHQLLTQFLGTVLWGELDYLIIDLPPGTGDAQLTLTQQAPLAGAVIVTTPQDVALEDVRRGVEMFNKVNVPVIGVVENMSFFCCPNCGHRSDIFSHGGGRKMSEQLGAPFLGEVPIDIEIREAGDAGTPVVAARPESAAAKCFQAIAGEMARRVSTLNLQGAGAAGAADVQWVN